MDLTTQLLMGLALAGTCGLRAFLPLLITGLLAHGHYLELNPHLMVLARTDVLVVLGVASLLEFAGDKIIAVDHALDAIGTVVRPIAGAVLASAMLTHADPGTTLVLGMLAGGGTALTVHAGKTAARYKSTAVAAAHLGAGNLGLSVVEDVLVTGWVWLGVHAPLAAFFVTLLFMAGSIGLVLSLLHLTRRGVRFLKQRRRPPAAPGT